MLICEICKYQTKYKSNLTQHSYIHKNEIVNCEKCNYSTSNKVNLNKHYRNVHSMYKNDRNKFKQTNQININIEGNNNTVINNNITNNNITNNNVTNNYQIVFSYLYPYISEDIRDNITKYFQQIRNDENIKPKTIVAEVFKLIYYDPAHRYNNSIGLKSVRDEQVIVYNDAKYSVQSYEKIHDTIIKNIANEIKINHNDAIDDKKLEKLDNIPKISILRRCSDNQNKQIFNNTKSIIDQQIYDKSKENEAIAKLIEENKRKEQEKEKQQKNE